MSEMMRLFGFGIKRNEEREKIIKESFEKTNQIDLRDGQTYDTSFGPTRLENLNEKYL